MSNDTYSRESNAGWSSTWQQFLNASEANFLSELEAFYSHLPWTGDLSPSQRRAWQKEYCVMQATLKAAIEATSIESSLCWIAFEQELPGEAGKRAADVNLILPTGHLLVIEFKDKSQASEAEIWRASFDLNTLSRFHSESTALKGHGYLALTAPAARTFKHSEIKCVIPNSSGNLLELQKDIAAFIKGCPHTYNTHQWHKGRFHRQPSILAGTVEVFFNESIPTLHTEAGQNIIEAREAIQKLYLQAKQHKERYIVLVGGAPGAGKTLLGLSTVADTIQTHTAAQSAPVYLSGNNPLVGVLQYTLDYFANKTRRQAVYDARTIIQPVLEFKKQFGRNQADYDLVVFDEAQRAWDSVKGQPGTELDLFCQWLSQRDYGLLLLLIGDGQAIHTKEMPLETMLDSLSETLLMHQDRLKVVTPSNYEAALSTVPGKSINNSFYLKSAIRQHFAQGFEQWLEAVMNADAQTAHAKARQLGGFPLKLTNSKALAEQFAKNTHAELHQSKPGKADQYRYGWFTSSKSGDKALKQLYGGQDSRNVFGPWYVNNANDPQSCCQLKSAATEFGCQGLEISLALVNWGQDLLIRGGRWQLSQNRYLRREHDDFTYATYRVLLSRGRSGLVVSCQDPETYKFLNDCGLEVLTN